MRSTPWPRPCRPRITRPLSPITWSSRPTPAWCGPKPARSSAPAPCSRVVFRQQGAGAEARKILRTRALLPKHNLAAYKRMLNDFITVANLLQPGPGYGTTHQDYGAWYQALHASNITVY